MNDLGIYQERMHRSMEDKLFFLDEIDMSEISLIVDFGCADGALLRELRKNCPGVYLIGYDRIYDEFVLTNSIFFTSNWDWVKGEVAKNTTGKTLLILSSVLHEMTETEFGTLFHAVNGKLKFDYVSIRDMTSRSNIRSAPSELIEKIRADVSIADQLKDFEDFYSRGINWLDQCIHFLLKMDYVENWPTELHENYFSFNQDRVTDLLYIMDNYSVRYMKQYILPFFQKKVEDRYGVRLTEPTHIKMILEKTC